MGLGQPTRSLPGFPARDPDPCDSLSRSQATPTAASTASPTSLPTASPTARPTFKNEYIVKQTLVLAVAPLSYKGDVKICSEKAYGQVLGIFDTASGWAPQCSVTSSLSSSLQITFEARASDAKGTSSEAAAATLAVIPSKFDVAYAAVKRAIPTYANLTMLSASSGSSVTTAGGCSAGCPQAPSAGATGGPSFLWEGTSVDVLPLCTSAACWSQFSANSFTEMPTGVHTLLNNAKTWRPIHVAPAAALPGTATNFITGYTWESSFGSAVALSATHLVVGAEGSNKIFIFNKDAKGNIGSTANAIIAEESSFFGSSVALSSTHLVVGAAMPNLNIAQGKEARQSNTARRRYRAAHYAVDGLTECVGERAKDSTGQFGHVDQWWSVDLLKSVAVKNVQVFEYSGNIDGATVKVGDNATDPGSAVTCGVISKVANTVMYDVACNGKSGRYVFVTKAAGSSPWSGLRLCEVKVFKAPTAATTTTTSWTK